MAILLQYTDDSITKYDDSYYRFFSKLIYEIFLSICNQFVKPQLRPFLFFFKSINLSMQFFEHHLGTILELESDNIPQPPNVISSQNFEMNG